VRDAVGRLRAGGSLPGEAGAAVAARVQEGSALSEALRLHADRIPAEDVALIEAGETTGNLDRTLDRLADRHEARRSARRRFVTEALYPLLLFHLAAFLTPLPPAVAKDGRVFGPTWWKTTLAILVPAYVLAGIAFWVNRTVRGRALVRRVVDYVPGFGHAARRRRRADLAEVTGAAYEAGVRLDRAVALGGRAIGDERVEKAAREVGRGQTLRDALALAGALPGPLLARIAIGEESGELGKVLAEVAREEAEAADHLYRRSTQLAAKGLYLAVALWIVFYYVSTMLGIYAPLLK
jgi:type II secretory pathway component PulF